MAMLMSGLKGILALGCFSLCVNQAAEEIKFSSLPLLKLLPTDFCVPGQISFTAVINVVLLYNFTFSLMLLNFGPNKLEFFFYFETQFCGGIFL